GSLRHVDQDRAACVLDRAEPPSLACVTHNRERRHESAKANLVRCRLRAGLTLGSCGRPVGRRRDASASAARKHIAGVKYEDIPSPKATKSATGAVPQKSIGIRKR